MDNISEVISDEEFNKLLDQQVEALVQQSKEKSLKSIPPDLFIFEIRNDEGRHPLTIIAIRSNDFNTKRYELMEALGKKSAIDMVMPVAVFIVTEAWAKAFTPEQVLERKGKEVSEYDDKKEIALIAGMTIDGRTNMATLDIKRVGKSLKLVKPWVCPYLLDTPRSKSDLLTSFMAGYLNQITANRANNNQ